MGRVEPKPELELTWDQTLAWRLKRQLLVGAASSDPVHTVSALAGVQTQVATSATQALVIRGDTVPDLDDLLWKRRSLIKTWAMRGTLHLLPAAEIGVWFSALRQRPWKITAAWERHHGITASQLAAITESIPEILSATPMTREELTGSIVDRVRDPELGVALASGWSQVLKPAANQGLLAQGPPRGKHVTFVDPSQWLGKVAADVDPKPAMSTVVARFLDSSGPAGVDDFARWLGVDPKTGRELMTPHLLDMVPVSVEGLTGWLTPKGATEVGDHDPPTGVLLLPGFDPYTLAPLSHRRYTIPEGKVDLVSRKAGWISPVILDEGRVIGTWETGTDEVVVSPFAKLGRSKLAGLSDHIEGRYHGLLGASPRLVVSVSG